MFILGLRRSGKRHGMPARGPEPFISYAFLAALEDSGAVGGRSGWRPRYAVLRDDKGEVVAVAPSYAKTNSYGEYVFDHGWANAFERAGGRYYPKLQVAVPFSPVPGPRAAARPGAPWLAWPRRWKRWRRSWAAPPSTPPSARARSGTRWAKPAGCSGWACNIHWENQG